MLKIEQANVPPGVTRLSGAEVHTLLPPSFGKAVEIEYEEP